MGGVLTTSARTTTTNVARTVPTRSAPSVRTGDDEWAALLKDMSGAIQSRRWDGVAIAARAAEEEHPAARGAKVRGHLPRTGAVKSSERQAGMLTQAEVVAVYKLRRTNAEKWTPSALAARFGARQSDIAALLRYSRTYTAHATPEGVVRGFYDVHAVPLLERFEDVR